MKLVSSSEGDGLHWLSLHQLLVLFQWQTGFIGIQRKSKLRAYELLTDVGESYDFLELARHFGIYLKALTSFAKCTWSPTLRRPAGACFNCKFRCVRLRVHNDLLKVVDQQFVGQGVVPISGCHSFANFGIVKRTP